MTSILFQCTHRLDGSNAHGASRVWKFGKTTLRVATTEITKQAVSGIKGVELVDPDTPFPEFAVSYPAMQAMQ